MTNLLDCDALIIGGGPAGLQAAMMLGRARRRVLVCDIGSPRNAPAPHAHGVFTRDGTPPLELLRLARQDLAAYPGVSFREAAVTGAKPRDGGFAVTLSDGDGTTTTVLARGLVVASGMRDVLPALPGFRELWGTGLFACPYCHGWEVRGQPLAVYAPNQPHGPMMAYLLRAWTDDVVLLTGGPALFDDAERAKLARNGIAVVETPIAGLEVAPDGGLGTIRLADGTGLARRAMAFKPEATPRSRVHLDLGAQVGEDGLPVLSMMNMTTVPGVFVGGDLMTMAPSVPGAVASGAMAGAGLNMWLALGEAASR